MQGLLILDVSGDLVFSVCVLSVPQFSLAAKENKIIDMVAMTSITMILLPFTAHFEIFHCTHHPVIPKSDLYFTFCSTLMCP